MRRYLLQNWKKKYKKKHPKKPNKSKPPEVFTYSFWKNTFIWITDYELRAVRNRKSAMQNGLEMSRSVKLGLLKWEYWICSCSHWNIATSGFPSQKLWTKGAKKEKKYFNSEEPLLWLWKKINMEVHLKKGKCWGLMKISSTLLYLH